MWIDSTGGPGGGRCCTLAFKAATWTLAAADLRRGQRVKSWCVARDTWHAALSRVSGIWLLRLSFFPWSEPGTRRVCPRQGYCFNLQVSAVKSRRCSLPLWSPWDSGFQVLDPELKKIYDRALNGYLSAGLTLAQNLQFRLKALGLLYRSASVPTSKKKKVRLCSQ